jgi:hypothetical protein
MTFVRHHTLLTICVVRTVNRGEDFIEGFWDGAEWLYMIIWGGPTRVSRGGVPI